MTRQRFLPKLPESDQDCSLGPVELLKVVRLGIGERLPRRPLGFGRVPQAQRLESLVKNLPQCLLEDKPCDEGPRVERPFLLPTARMPALDRAASSGPQARL